MHIIGVIPARMASTRFPGKPLAKICRIPMIGHVYFRSKMCKMLKEVYIATCDKEITDYAQSVEARTIMTKDTHERASDRVAEAVFKIEEETKEKTDIVVMIQGDEPMVQPKMLEESIMPLLNDQHIQVVNLMSEIKSRQEQEDPNTIKVVIDLNKFALYFSREPIPSWKKGAKNVPMFKQVCIIPFKRDFLIKFNELSPTPLEVVESVDMLRIIEHGYKVRMALTNFETYSVDTREDLKRAEKYISKDPLFKIYQSSKEKIPVI